ncbi:MAG: alpha-hydroxy-acid oxidizing protein [Nitratireductor sp.]|nr:alpha-hydroxy-acid oxidizing protein [Nitratireductor sp.]
MAVERDLGTAFPLISDLAARAKRRIPHFAWEYLESGTGLEQALVRNRAAFDSILISPRFMKGDLAPAISSELFGRRWDAPFGVAPIGLTGMMWPGGELMLARAAREANIPYCLSSFACEGPEEVGPLAGENGWFQLYTVSDEKAEDDILARAEAAGFSSLIITVDVPVNSTRERQRKAGLGRHSRMSPRQMMQIASRPQWALATARHGQPTFKTVARYFPGASMGEIGKLLDRMKLGMTSLAGLERIRKRWKKPLIIKGIMDSADAETAIGAGADAIVVSNHGARQFDAVPAAIDALPGIVEAVGGRVPVLFDSGVRTGLDLLRALVLGADFVLVGRPFLFGTCALGEPGARLVAKILKDDLTNNMIQAGAQSLAELRRLGWTRAAPAPL